MDRRLQTFLEVVRRGSLTAAARHLNMAQPSLTKRLRLLEEEYGCSLLERGIHGARPTPEGKALLHHAEHIETEYRQASEAVAAARGEKPALLRIGAGPLFHLRYLADALLVVRSEHAETRIELVTGLYRETMPQLSQHRLDVVFGADEGVPVAATLQFEEMTRVEQGVALRLDHPLLRRRIPDAEALSQLDWVVYGDCQDDATLVNAFFRRNGQRPPPMPLITSSFTLGLQTVARSDAAMMVPIALAANLNVPNVSVVRTAPAIADLPAGAFMRHSTSEFSVTQTLTKAVRSAFSSKK
ncbi:LysR family transcriptional regulator [uncultured Jannaschia sp.]|uniref:LysR family transcriptional regulator n=1 Tax=uncultured Jannaschia sp. TaxID=293347 RepID=UPI00260D4CD6|nr:LysR family transcriptional regulator [uncultured Jannaschia sp.]